MTTATQTPVRSDRALLVSTLHQPELAKLWEALRFLRDNKGVDLRNITALEIMPQLALSNGHTTYWMCYVNEQWLVIDHEGAIGFSAYNLDENGYPS